MLPAGGAPGRPNRSVPSSELPHTPVPTGGVLPLTLARSSARSLPQAIGAVGPAPGASFDLGRSSRSLKFYLTEWKLSLGTTSP